MKQQYQIRLTETEDVKDFVNSAGKCDFDIDICYNRVIIDAKSILGVLGMDRSHILTVRCAGSNPEFEQTISKYIVA